MNQLPLGNQQPIGSSFDPNQSSQSNNFLTPSPSLVPSTGNDIYASSTSPLNNNIPNNQRSMSIDFSNFLSNDPNSTSSLPGGGPLNSSVTSASNIGIRTRHRSGTLPSKLNAGVPPSVTTSNTSASNTPLLHPEIGSVNVQISPALDAVFEDSTDFQSQLRNNQQQQKPQQQQARLRSSSIQSSIWSDGLSILNSQEASSPGFMSNAGNGVINNPLFNQQQIPQLNIDLDSLLSTTNSSTPPFNPVNRIRSYSANNVLFNPSDKHFMHQYTPIKEEYFVPQLQSENQQQQQQQQHQTLMDDFNNRPRSQTYGGFADFNFQPQFLENTFGSQQPPTLQQQINSNLQTQPFLQDNLPESCISITSTHTNPSLGPTNTILIINLPNDSALTNSMNFYRMLSQFGVVLSIRIITCNENGDLVAIAEFADVESAMRCKAKMNYLELVPGLSCIVSFAKILALNNIPVGSNNQQPLMNQHHHQQSQPHQQQPNRQQVFSNHSQQQGQQQGHQMRPNDIPVITTTDDLKDDQVNENIQLTTLNDKIDVFKPILEDVIGKDLSLTKEEKSHLRLMVARALEYTSLKQPSLGKLPDPLAVRQFDTPRLREIRKQMDANQLTKSDIEELALAMHDELPELASDYLGNTIVQKLFEVCDVPIRDSMIKVLSPFLAQMGAHKNGTWAAQKLINTIATEREKWMVAEALRPYCTQLFNDQYANYVIHGVLKFNQPWNDFIIETMLSTFLEISRNRFGARAIRTCLESDYVPKEALVGIAICVLTWCWELIIDSNGSLLITWFLDTCQMIEDRHLILADILIKGKPRTNDTALTDSEVSDNGKDESFTVIGDNEQGNVSDSDDGLNLIKICCSKLGNLSVLKVLNYRSDLKARDLILCEIFGDDLFRSGDNETLIPDELQNSNKLENLKKILIDRSSNGSTFIYKILSIPTIDSDLKKKLASRIRFILQDSNLLSNHQYKRLCEEIGLKSQHQRTLSISSRKKKSRSRSNSTNTNGSNGFSQVNNNNLVGVNLPLPIPLPPPQAQQLGNLPGLGQSTPNNVINGSNFIGAPQLNSNSFFPPLQQQHAPVDQLLKQNSQPSQSQQQAPPPGLFNSTGVNNGVNGLNPSISILPIPQNLLNTSNTNTNNSNTNNVNNVNVNNNGTASSSSSSNNINTNLDYDLLLRQQLEKMSLNNPNNFNSNNSHSFNTSSSNNNDQEQQHQQDQQLFY